MLKLKLQYYGHPMQRTDSLEKILILGKTDGKRRKGQQDEMVAWNHWLSGHEFDRIPGDSEGQVKPSMLQFTESQRLGHNLATEQ